jgi:hypothetical protein
MAMAAKGLSAQHLLYLLLSTGSAALMIWMHAGITRRLTRGASLRMGAERVRAQGWWLALPGPPAFWATFRKDWTYLWRSPLPRRLAFSALVSMAAVAVPLLDRSSAKSLRAVPLIAGAFVISLTSMIVNLGLSANYFGTVDREGFATLAASPLDRRLVILSANLTALLFVGAVHLLLATTIAALTRNWLLLPLGMYLSLCMQIGAAPAYTLAAIIGPYRAQLRFSGGRQRGNMWGVLAWLLSAAPLLALLLLPYLFWRPGLAFALPLGPAYSLGLYLSTLKPLARLLRNQEHRILQAVTSAD